MKPRRVRCLLLALCLLPAVSFGEPAAQTAKDVCRQASEAVLSAQSQWGSNAAKISEDIISPSRSVFNVDCLSKLTYGIRYSISSIFSGFDLRKMICRALESVVRRYSSSIHYSASLPYGILGIEVGGYAGIEPGNGGGGDLFGSGILITNYDQNRVDTGSILDAIYQTDVTGANGSATTVTSGPSPSTLAVSPTTPSGTSGSTPYNAGGGR